MKLEKLSISSGDKLTLIGNITTMLTAGIPLLEVIQTLTEESRGNLKNLLDHIKETLVEGGTLSLAFSHFPKIFSRININILKSSEQSGNLEATLRDLQQGIRRDMEFTDKIKAALLYPVILLVVFFGMFLVILLFVIPRIATIFSNLRVVLPLPTKIMIAMSHALTSYTLPIVIAIAVLIFLTIYLYREKKRSFLIFFSKLPVISKLIREIDLTRFTRSFALLLASNVPISVALDLCRDVVINQRINQAINNSKDIITSGGKLSEGLKNSHKEIPSVMVKIIESGEKTGTLDKSMQDISEYLDYNVVNDLKTVTTLLEPIILVLVGIFLGAMMLAIIAPIYNLIGQINAH
ncbi:MAG: type II secretion system F family protein [Candidatus Shapirobacteria bacterium]|nr:type II secretion system F family protein [Candidatus Shapirobacteria bacterium]